MSTASKNIFAQLNDDSDNEAPVVKKSTAPVKAVEAAKPAAQSTNERAPRGAGRGGERRNNGGDGEPRQNKEHHKPRDSRDNQKPKGVSSQPHPNDRHSGTGSQAYGSKFRKEGGGRHNFGTVKDEVKSLNEGERAPVKVEETPAVVEVPEEPVVVDNTITVEEYFRRLGVTGEQTVTEAPKRELNHDELKRDKLQVVVSKTEKTLDANVIKAQKKKNSNNPTYLLGCNTENSELLGVKSGQVTVKFTEKPEGGDKVPRENNKETRAPRENNNNNNKAPKTLKRAQVDNEADFPKLA